MLSNTGTVSLWLYGIFILIALIGMIVAFWLMKKGAIDEGKMAKMVELFKWTILTVGIGTVAFIVTNLFKEREQDLKELEYFNKYVEDVKKADGLEERLRLVKYLSIVSPSGTIKESWQAYYEVVLKEYEEYLELKAQQYTGDSLMQMTVEERIEAIDKQVKLNAFQRPLSGREGEAAKPLIYIQYCNREQAPRMREIRTMFLDHSWNAPGIDLVEGGCDNTIRYFHDDDYELAQQANRLLEKKYVVRKVALRAPRGQVELWVGE